MRHVFETAPEPGTILKLDDQPYTVEAVEPYTRKSDGAASSLIHWHFACADCGRDARFISGLAIRDINRRCSICATPMRRVNSKRSRRSKLKVSIIPAATAIDPQSLF